MVYSKIHTQKFLDFFQDTCIRSLEEGNETKDLLYKLAT